MYRLINRMSEIGEFMSELSLSEVASLDTETTGLDPHTCTLTLVQIGLVHNIYIFDFRKFGRENLAKILTMLEESKKTIILHNAKFDWKFLYKNSGIKLFNVYDTMLAEVMLTMGVGDRYYSYADLVFNYTGTTISKEERNEFIDNPDIVLTEQVLLYSALDVLYLESIYRQQRLKLEEQGLSTACDLIEMPVIPATAEMEFYGIKLNVENWKKLEAVARENAEKSSKLFFDGLIDKITKELKYKTLLDIYDTLNLPKIPKYKRELYSQISDEQSIREFLRENLNLNSTNQLLAVFQKVYKIMDKRKKKLIDSTNEKVINKYLLQYPEIQDLLDYRGYIKGAMSFGETYSSRVNPVTGRIHTDLHQLGARTSRYASSEPDMQNILRDSEYRQEFIAEDGWLLGCSDFSQQELRATAEITEDKALTEMFEKRIDPHTFTASRLFEKEPEAITKEERSKAKNVNFGVSYGSTEYGLYHNFGIPIKEGREYLKRYWQTYYGYANFKRSAEKLIWKLGYSVTLTDRKRYFKKPLSYESPEQFESYRAKIFREQINFIIQGTCAEITKLALIYLQRRNPFGEDFRLLLQVHDEVVVEVKEELSTEAEKFISECMLDAERYFIKKIECAIEVKMSKHWEH